ncbi:signal peptidase I [Leifsonia sp. YAF41]|uniref:signal peptidase I n=1 Tax=Leifsonia sp. YAF41 TaxID=3233086 RepID=UPI003F9BA25A
MTFDETSPPTVRPGRPGSSSSTLKFVRDLLVIVIVAILVSALVKAFLVRAFFIPSESMEGTLRVQDRILVNELVPAVIPIEHGDVVVFRDPGGWLDAPPPAATGLTGMLDGALAFVGLSASDSENHLIKRVIGLPGDTVVCCTASGQLSVNGISLDEPYIQVPSENSLSAKAAFSVTVPTGSLWVMGDNRFNSADSAYHYLKTDDPATGFVARDDVVGRAFVVSWPTQHWAWLDNFPATFAGTPPSDAR